MEEGEREGVAFVEVGGVGVETGAGVEVGEEADVGEFPAEDCERNFIVRWGGRVNWIPAGRAGLGSKTYCRR